ncbi:general odorant-binding protein 56d-like [Eupeodes corollae]|uniref:general odorant-binding protein 56d-like n=1 Tax=Eupeodes corollae TaxID=290404 RepID=UPI0024916440|nr:general odorant-binding protein 56d-like [Eupeodes corollae]XP_055903955.1 general odorant-binding protein 56d-like [Eupeodes corollae]
MKFPLIVAFIALMVISIVIADHDYPNETTKEELDKKAAECRSKFKVTDEDYKKMLVEFAEPSETMKFLSNCLLEVVGILKNGILQPDIAIEVFKSGYREEKAIRIVEACRNEVGIGKCGTANKLDMCFLNNQYLKS